MVSTSTVFFFFFFFMIFSCFASSMEARKLLRVQEMEKKMVPSEEKAEAETATAAAVDVSLYLNALPKGKVPASTPSDKGHEQIIDEKLIARHLVAVDRILRSVPSPGVGH